jgi:hypothetical protein
MNIPKDPNGTGPEDVEAHRAYNPDDVQAAEQRDTGQDVEAHRMYSSDDAQTAEQRDTGEDVEGHGRAH